MTVRVLQVLGRSAGGVGRHVARVVELLDSPDMVVDVAAPEGLGLSVARAVRVAIPRGPRGHLRAVAELEEVVRSGGYDVVHGHGLRAGLDAAVAARRAGIPALASVHNLVRADVSGWARAVLFRWAEPALVSVAARTFAASEEIAGHLRRSAPWAAGKVEVLYVCAAPPRVRRGAAEIRAEIGSPARLVVTAARLAPQKNLPVLLRALSRLPSDVELAVLGTGALEPELKALAAALGVGARVHWLGFREDAADWIAAADVFCLSSNWEAVPLAVQEAVMLGTPVVSTAVGGVGELIEDGVSGRLVPKGNAPALAAALEEVLGSQETADALVARARTALERRFSERDMAARLREAYLCASR